MVCQLEYVRRIDTVCVGPEQIVQHFSKNLRMRNTLYNARSFKLSGFKHDGVATANVGVDPRNDGAYYPDTPHPVWVPPQMFVRDGEHRIVGLPDKAENKRILRDTVDAKEGSDEFQSHHETSMEAWREMWKNAVRNDLTDEITFTFRRHDGSVETHAASVRYESD